ncbi:MAG: MATE family efflux transporter [Parasporobacterium sp.]|nr:MATE family efflux transporter [Parasporobacterium sp.]
MNTVKHIDFSNRQLVKLIWPLILEQFLSLAVGLADSIMVAQVGDAAVSGVSLVDSVSVLMVYIFSAMAAGGAAVCGQYLGRNGRQDARSAGQHLMGLMVMVSLLITGLLYLFKSFIIGKLFGQIDADVMAATNTYYLIVMGAIPGIALYNGGTALFRAMERTDMTLKISLIMNVINVAGNAVMIFGMGCGVEGVAVPTLVSRWVAAGIIVILLFNKKYLLHLSDFRKFRFNRRILGNIIRIGIPGGVENGMFQFGKIVLYSFISTMGTASITANAVGGTLSTLNVMPGMAINLAITTVISQCIGAGAFDKARYYYKKLVIWTYVSTAVWVGILFLCLPGILRIYNVAPEASVLARNIELLHGTSTALIWIPAFMTPTFLRSAGDATFTMVVSVLSMWLGRVLGAFILGKYFGLGVMGVWLAHTIIDWLVRSGFFNYRYFKGTWMNKAIKD